MRALLWTTLLVGCARLAAPPPLSPALFSPQLANDRSIVVGRVLGAAIPDTLGNPHIVVVDTAGRSYPMRVVRLTGSDMQMHVGDTVTAWCHGAGADLVADSVRVEPRL